VPERSSGVEEKAKTAQKRDDKLRTDLTGGSAITRTGGKTDHCRKARMVNVVGGKMRRILGDRNGQSWDWGGEREVS